MEAACRGRSTSNKDAWAGNLRPRSDCGTTVLWGGLLKACLKRHLRTKAIASKCQINADAESPLVRQIDFTHA